MIRRRWEWERGGDGTVYGRDGVRHSGRRIHACESSWLCGERNVNIFIFREFQ
jgi:hypothetical protein